MVSDLAIINWLLGVHRISLNPCSNGIWSRTRTWDAFSVALGVLILVLMEYGLGLRHNREIASRNVVLILVLMEYGLGLNNEELYIPDFYAS